MKLSRFRRDKDAGEDFITVVLYMTKAQSQALTVTKVE